MECTAQQLLLHRLVARERKSTWRINGVPKSQHEVPTRTSLYWVLQFNAFHRSFPYFNCVLYKNKCVTCCWFFRAAASRSRRFCWSQVLFRCAGNSAKTSFLNPDQQIQKIKKTTSCTKKNGKYKNCKINLDKTKTLCGQVEPASLSNALSDEKAQNNSVWSARIPHHRSLQSAIQSLISPQKLGYQFASVLFTLWLSLNTVKRKSVQIRHCQVYWPLWVPECSKARTHRGVVVESMSYLQNIE